MRRLRSMSSAFECVRNGLAISAAGQALEDGRLDLDETLVGHRRPQRGQRLEPDVEDAPRVRVGQQVDLALAVPHVLVAQAMPLVGQGPDGLGQHGQRDDVDRELTPAARHHLARRPDPVPQIEGVANGRGVVTEVGRAHQELDTPTDVLQRGEDQLAVAPDARHPSRHAHLCPRPGIRTEVGVALVELRRSVGPVEAQRVRVETAAAQPVALGPSLLHERGGGGSALGPGLALGLAFGAFLHLDPPRPLDRRSTCELGTFSLPT